MFDARAEQHPEVLGAREMDAVRNARASRPNRRFAILAMSISARPIRLWVGGRTMKLNTYVNFAGKCAEAFRFYEKHLGGKIGMMMTHGQAPDQSHVKPGMEGRGAARAHLDRRHRIDGRGHPERSADAERLPVARRPERRRSGAHLFGALGGRRSVHTDTGDVLRHAIRSAPRSIRHQLDDHPRTADAAQP